MLFKAQTYDNHVSESKMGRNSGVLAAKGGFIAETYRDGGVSACVRKLVAAVRMSLPLVALGRRTNGSVVNGSFAPTARTMSMRELTVP